METPMINFRQIFLAIACLALVWATSASAAPGRAAMLTSFCATNGDKAAALEQLVETGVSDDTHERAWARQVVDAIRNGALVCSADAQATLQGNPALDAATLQPRTNAAADSPYVPSIVMMRKLAVASAEMDLFSPQQDTRATAAHQVDKFFALLDPTVVARAVKAQHDPDTATILTLALAKRGLNSNVKADRLA
ncbi:MAG: urea transport system permease protein, partial [Caballeronia sp.]|nr:urea transport system permease protein [Caballeronia sp.]